MKQLLLTLFLLGYGAVAMAQGGDQQKKLEVRKAEIQREIKALNSLIKGESSKEKSVLSKIADNEAKIKLSEKLINTTQKQTRLLTDDIYLNQLKINKLNKQLVVLKEDYAKTLLNAYKSRSDQSRIMFILSSDNFLEAYKRVQYMKQYASFRKVQGEEIRDKMKELEMLQEKLGVQKKDKEKLLAESRKDKQELEGDREEQKKLAKVIQKDKKKYTAEVKSKQKESREIDRKIDAMIRAAIAEANRKAAAAKKAAEAKSAASSSASESRKATASKPAEAKASSSKIMLTKEGKVISDNFKANKGRLPWPVEGYIALGYGKQAHPVIDGVEINNHGIDFRTKPSAPVKAVFSGEVLSIQVLRSNNKTVCVQHGDFLTIYSNLRSVDVSPGDKVSINQKIGNVGEDYEGQPILKFIVSQNDKLQNPSLWLVK
ncbi:murein hydrolase activator EnvC family protein [Flavobacterium psychrotrophum]|uniref:murein hydrolase activator EnvC family protein n=1 Tax=Flavobacterium psychrotrophum TaxID=2294119 RepID=UPI000E31874C|nr:peptidoglycan DD-metalloendopeptidase family protein [Flavobacterium psychrotrophum]